MASQSSQTRVEKRAEAAKKIADDRAKQVAARQKLKEESAARKQTRDAKIEERKRVAAAAEKAAFNAEIAAKRLYADRIYASITDAAIGGAAPGPAGTTIHTHMTYTLTEQDGSMYHVKRAGQYSYYPQSLIENIRCSECKDRGVRYTPGPDLYPFGPGSYSGVVEKVVIRAAPTNQLATDVANLRAELERRGVADAQLTQLLQQVIASSQRRP